MKLSISIDAKKLEAAMKRAPAEMARSLRPAMGMAVRDVQRDAKKNHRFVSHTGNAENHILTDVSKDGMTGTVRLEKGGCPYVGYLHTGTKPHKITAKNKKSLYWVSGGTGNHAKSVEHPGTRPDPFLYNALARNADNIKKKFQAAIHRAIEKAFA